MKRTNPANNGMETRWLEEVFVDDPSHKKKGEGKKNKNQKRAYTMTKMNLKLPFA